jgi:hypothetical protein
VSQRRSVRFSASFFDRLDELLPAERTAAGTPSAADFLLHEIPPIIDRLAESYESVTLSVESLPNVRVLITAGALVPTIALYTTLAADDAVQVLYLDISD